MRRFANYRPRLVLAGLWFATTAAFCSGQIPERQDRSAAADPVRAYVLQYFASLPGYRPGDLISQSQVKPLLGGLPELGVELADPEALVARVPADGSFLVRALRTRQGREFMRYAAGAPNIYDRMDKMSRMRRGQKTVRELISRGRKGADVFDYLANDPDGEKAGKLMARRGQSSDFNKQTKKIYTVEELIEALKNPAPAKKP